MHWDCLSMRCDCLQSAFENWKFLEFNLNLNGIVSAITLIKPWLCNTLYSYACMYNANIYTNFPSCTCLKKLIKQIQIDLKTPWHCEVVNLLAYHINSHNKAKYCRITKYPVSTVYIHKPNSNFNRVFLITLVLTPSLRLQVLQMIEKAVYEYIHSWSA